MASTTAPATALSDQVPPGVLVIDVGGTHAKILASEATEPRKVASGPSMSAAAMVAAVRSLADGWSFTRVSMGYPGSVRHGQPAVEPHNLAEGWVDFDYAKAFGCPVRIVNDAAMQALGDYAGGRMLFLGLGTGLGTALVIDGVVHGMEMAHLPYRKGRTYEEHLGEAGRKRLGGRRWRRHVFAVADMLRNAMQVDEVVIGGGNAKRLDEAPEGMRLSCNAAAFTGGFRLWAGTAVVDSA